MPRENYNEYQESTLESNQEEIKNAIEKAKRIDEVYKSTNSDLNNLKFNNILWWKKVDFKTPDYIDKFYRLEWNKIIFNLDQVKNYLQVVYQRLQWMKNQKFWEISKENNFTWTILAIQIVLKAMKQDPINPKKYNVWRINWEYNNITQGSIKQFQNDLNLNWDGKPWKTTIWKILTSLDKVIENRKKYTMIKNIVRDSISRNLTTAMSLWVLNNEEESKKITDYIIKWNLWTNSDPDMENKINKIAKFPLNDQLRNIIKERNEKGKLNILNMDEKFSITKYDELIIQLSKKYSEQEKVDPALIKIIMQRESRFKPNARSRAWAKWLMQLMPIAVEQVNKEKTIIKNVYDPKQNIEGGIKLFSWNLNSYNWNIRYALAAYNWGWWNLGDLIRKTTERLGIKKEKLLGSNELFDKEVKPKLPKETRDYINEIVPKYESLYS